MPIEHSNEVDLIRQTLAGDTAAFDRLVKAHRTTVYVLVFSYTKNPADAEDLTQQIFIQAYERLATLRELDRFLPWIQRITHNTCKDWLRRQSDSTISFEELNHADYTETVLSPEDIALKREVKAIVQEAIGTLTETDRKLVEGRYIEGASYDQLQVESGLSYAAIANRLKRAKQQLRRRIERLLGGMAILPGRTLISGGIEIVKLSVKTKLAAVGIVAVIGIGGGVWYQYAFESNPVSESQSAVVNELGESEPEAVTKETSTVPAKLSNRPVKALNQNNAEGLISPLVKKETRLQEKTSPNKLNSEISQNDEERKLEEEFERILEEIEAERPTRKEIVTKARTLIIEARKAAPIADQYTRQILELVSQKPPVHPDTGKRLRALEEACRPYSQILADAYWFLNDENTVDILGEWVKEEAEKIFAPLDWWGVSVVPVEE